jgi:hypothetical protein
LLLWLAIDCDKFFINSHREVVEYFFGWVLLTIQSDFDKLNFQVLLILGSCFLLNYIDFRDFWSLSLVAGVWNSLFPFLSFGFHMSDDFSKFHRPEIDLRLLYYVEWTADLRFPAYDLIYFFVRSCPSINYFQRRKKLLHAIKPDKKSKKN